MTLPFTRYYFLFIVVLHVSALHLNLRGEVFTKRSHISGLDNGQNLKYYTNISLGGSQFSASIDTGSSDLWVVGEVPDSKDTGVSTGVQYAIGSISGHIKTAPLTFLEFDVPDQAFIHVNASATYPEGRSLIGLGPNVGSNIHDALKKQPRGDTVLDRIFRQNLTTPNILTVLLSRSDRSTEQFPGEITVSDIIPGMENITDQPKLAVKTVPSSRSGNQHWQVLLDPDGIIGPDGQPIHFRTKVSSTKNTSQLTAIFDTGFTFNQVPRHISDAIYSRIPNATFDNNTANGPMWTLPCTTEVNTTIQFGNMSYPIHPLDINFSFTDSSNASDTSDNQTCFGAFQPITTGAAPDYDIILGMAFLRNAYLLINYGDYVDGANTKAQPYVQLLSTTDPTSAHLDFVNVRLGGTDTTGGQMLSASNPDNVDGIDTPFRRKKKTAKIIGAVIGTVFLVATGMIAYFVYKRWRKRRLVPASDFSTADMGSYRPLQHAAPAGEFRGVQGYHDGVTSTRDFNPEDLYAPVAPLHEENHSIVLPRYADTDPRNTR
ncbi:aspartic peptidase domain-containing protein [Lactarius akahatsu]|uniref:Aspartic peptidase domain-containing protein n=1 Tax=Lactarius akahatsu TaxID=416441 RepID=A0AAD4LTD2_9AGAM|nr:aspartic peptidase domain-containing protein [Lactarius akahatsu]